MRSRGSQPSWIACRVIEKAPVMIDWLAMMVATVASTISGDQQRPGTEPKEDVAVGRRAVEHERRLPGVVEDQAWKHDRAPREPDRPLAEMAHIGVERLGAGHAEKHAPSTRKPVAPFESR